MTDEKRYTERDMVLAQREAWQNGAACHSTHKTFGDIRRDAEKRYPLPKVTRPRVVVVQGREWKVAPDGQLLSRAAEPPGFSVGERTWTMRSQLMPIVRDINALADLLANPTETVEDES